MFFGIVIPNFKGLTPFASSDAIPFESNVIDLITDKVTIYPPSSKYVLCIVSEENIPITIRDQLIPIVIQTGFEAPVRAYQHYYFRVEDITDSTLNRKLMALRSKLIYSVSENLAPDGFYFRLETPMNDDATRRPYLYKMYYNEVPCYTFKGDTLLENFQASIKQKLGPLIASTYALNVMEVPHWYSKEMFRDIVEIGELQMRDKIVVEGPSSGELYLFYQEETNITEDTLTDSISEIRGRILSAVQLRIFPRRTPDEIIKSRQLRVTNNGQWFIPYQVNPNINLFSTLLQQCFNLKNLEELFWFLIWMAICPTYSFIEQELRISVNSETIKVCHSTKYLPDYMRVRSASRIKLPEQIVDRVRILYPDRLSLEELSELLTGQTYIYFYDQANNERAVLVHTKLDIPQIDRIVPSDYSLDRRISYDFDPALV